MKVIVGQVDNEEKEEIRILYEKEVALKNLLLINLSNKNENQVLNDLKKIQDLMSIWWKEKSTQYKWESSPNGMWEVSFTDAKITLVQDE